MLVDLLAAVPSIVFGLWGFLVLAPKIAPVQEFLNENLGWFFLFSDGNVSIAGGGTIFTAGVVLAVMILPIITSVAREVFALTPRAPHRGSAGARRDQVGSRADDCPAVRPQRCDRRFHARPRSRAR